MNEVFRQDIIITPGVADAGGRLSVHDTLRLFMDVASLHAEELGIGLSAMAARKLFWLTVRSKAVFRRRPRIGEAVTLSTWPQAPRELRCDRSYTVTDGAGDLLIAGKTEWTVLDTVSGGLKPLREVYPEGLRFETPAACPEPFFRIPDRFAPEDGYAEYRVRSTDIDLGGHMNNAAYVRAVLGSFTSAELHSLPLGTLDVVYRASCYEGDLLTLQKKQTEDGLLLRAAKGEETVLLLRMA